MTSINLLCQHIKFVIWYRLVFPIRCISRTANYNKNMMFPLLSYTYENISFRSHHVHSFSHAFCSITFPAHHFPAAGSRPVCHLFLRRADCRAFPAPSIRAPAETSGSIRSPSPYGWERHFRTASIMSLFSFPYFPLLSSHLCSSCPAVCSRMCRSDRTSRPFMALTHP